MKGIPFDLQLQQGKKGVFEVADFSSLVAAAVPCHSSSASSKWKNLNQQQQQQQQQQQGGGGTSSSKKKFVVGAGEPTSVLDTRRSPSPPTSSSTLSSSLGGSGGGGGGGGGGSTDTGGVAAVSDNPPHHNWPSTQEGTSSTATLVGVGVGVAAAVDLSPAATSAAGRPNSCSSKDDEWGGGGSELPPIPTSLDITNGVSGSGRCGGGGLGLGVEDWESMLSESTAAVVASSPSQDQSLLRWIMGDVEDPSSGLKQLLQGVGPSDMEQGGPNVGFGLTDPSFPFDNPPITISSTTSAAAAGGSSSSSMAMAIPSSGSGFTRGVLNSISNSSFPNKILTFNTNLGNPVFSSSPSPNPLPLPGVFYPQHQHQHQQQFEQQSDQKPQLLVNHPTQNQAIFLPLPYNHQDLMQPQAKRHQPDPHELFLRGAQHQQQGHSLRQQHQQQGFPQQLQLMPNNLQQQQLQKLAGFAGEEAAIMQQQQQALVDQLFKAAELLESGNLVHARGILARLNHHPHLSSPVGKPIVRSAFYFKEALQLIINNTNVNVVTTPPKRILTPFDVFLKIDTYKSFSELSPILQFVNFTCNQALLEALDNFHCIHIIDFDIGFGSQWASFMQEIALRVSGPPTLKITVVATPSSYDHPLELILTQENLAHFANDLGISFEFELLSLDSFESISLHEGEAIAVNLPPGSSSYHPSSLPSLLRLVKQIAPKIVVSVDRGCDRSDLPFSHHFLHGLQSYSVLFDSLDSINTNSDIVNKIERFLLQPRIESAVLRRHHILDKLPPWRTIFASAGFSPYTFSNFCETQAECVVKRLQVRGFHVEKRQASLMLYWQRRELVSASAWSC